MKTSLKIKQNVEIATGMVKYIDYKSLEHLDTEGYWENLADMPNWNNILVTNGEMICAMKRERPAGERSDELEYGGEGDLDEFWGKHIASNTDKMADIKLLYKIANRFDESENAIKTTKPKKIAARNKNKNLKSFKSSVSQKSRISHDESAKYRRVTRNSRDRTAKNKEKFKITLAEYKREFEKMKKNSAPGTDRMTWQMMPKTDKNMKKIIFFMNNLVFTQGSFPAKFQESRLNFIEKTPPSETGKMRPLAIGQRISALQARIMAARVHPHMDKDDKYKDRYGFRPDLGCEEYIGQAISTVQDWKEQGFEVGMIQCDVASAYTNVPHKKCVIAFHDFVKRMDGPDDDKPWYFVWFVQKWLADRVIFFEFTAIFMTCGVVQGCPFSPVAFVVFLSFRIHDIDCRFLFFADDSSCIVRARTLADLRTKMDEIYEKFSEWLKTKDLHCEPTKSRILIFYRTLVTAKRHFSDLHSIPVVDHMRVLGVEFDSRMTFNIHLQNVLNTMRRRVNLIWLLKKNGLGRSHALQFVQSARSKMFFGLYWLTVLSENQWKQLEMVWNALLRKAVHERTPRSIKLEILQQVSGLGTFRNFVHYLLHLRTTKSMKCDKFTLDHEFFIENPYHPTVSDSGRVVRDSTRTQTTRINQVAADKQQLKHVGSIKLFSIKLASENEWNSEQFKLEKSDLRKFYQVARQEPPSEIANLDSDNLLSYLKKAKLCFA